VCDYWLLGPYPSEEDMAATQKGQTASPIGKPRTKTEVPLVAPKILPAGKANKP
jgi:penicillin-binding protein 2